jgi:hypothetical protein
MLQVVYLHELNRDARSAKHKTLSLIRGHFEHHSLYIFQQYILKFGIFKIFDEETN